ncbi:hypothetical protein ACJBU6_01191 [Exserohilum turcicum]
MIRDASSAATNACHFSSPRLSSPPPSSCFTWASPFLLTYTPPPPPPPPPAVLSAAFCHSSWDTGPVLSFDLRISLSYTTPSYIPLLEPFRRLSPHSFIPHWSYH